MHIAKVAKEKQEQQQKEYYDKYFSIFQAAIDYLKKNNVLMYGGLALDQYMPDKLKIYDEYQLPDLDVFTSSPKNIANGLAAALIKKGYIHGTMVTKALHDGTFKVFSQGLPIADISYLPPAAIHKLGNGSKRGSLGIKLISPSFIRYSLHAMLAVSNVDRWEKVAKRITNFYKVFKPPKEKISDVTADLPDDVREVCEVVHMYTETQGCVLMGTPVLSDMLDKDIPAFANIPYNVAFVAGDPMRFAENMAASIPEVQFTISNMYPQYETLLQPQHVVVKYNNIPVAIFFEATMRCFGYNEIQGRRIATIHTVLTVYMGMLLSHDSHFKHMQKSLEIITNLLSSANLKTGTRRKIMKPYTLTCVGLEEGLATLRRKKFEKN